MSRSICIVFVALVIIQAAFANVGVEYGITNLELTNTTSPEAELLHSERMSSIIGDVTVGQHMDREETYTFKYRSENYERYVKVGILNFGIPEGKTIHYANAVNTNGIIAVMCATKYTLGSSRTLFYIRQPPNTESLITINVRAH